MIPCYSRFHNTRISARHVTQKDKKNPPIGWFFLSGTRWGLSLRIFNDARAVLPISPVTYRSIPLGKQHKPPFSRPPHPYTRLFCAYRSLSQPRKTPRFLFSCTNTGSRKAYGRMPNPGTSLPPRLQSRAVGNSYGYDSRSPVGYIHEYSASLFRNRRSFLRFLSGRPPKDQNRRHGIFPCSLRSTPVLCFRQTCTDSVS